MSRTFQRRTSGPAPRARAGRPLGRSRPFTLPAVPVASPGGATDLEASLSRAQRFGHSLDRLLAPSPTAAPPIQRKLKTGGLDSSGIDSEVLSSLLKSIQAFNEGEDSKEKRSEKQIHGQIARLDAIEREANGWLRKAQGAVEPEARQAIFSLLSQTEEHHTELIHQTIQGGHDLWLPESVDKEERAPTQKLWRSLVTGKGNVQIRSKDQDFQKQVHGSFAKLLEGKEGRKLLGDLNAPQEDEERRIILDRDFKDKKFRQTEDGSQPEGSLAEPIARLERDENLHGLLPKNKPNKGTGSYVRLAEEPTPTDEDDFQIGKGGEPIHAPRYITLGHELGHARRALQGESRPDFQDETKDLDSLLWRNPEEKVNISETENALRDEHDLPQRKYHVTGGAARAIVTRHKLEGKLDGIKKTWESAPKEIQRKLDDELGLSDIAYEIDHADTADSEKVKKLQKELEQIQRKLPVRIQELSPGLLTRAGRFIGNKWKPLLAGGIGLAAMGYALWNKWNSGEP